MRNILKKILNYNNKIKKIKTSIKKKITNKHGVWRLGIINQKISELDITNLKKNLTLLPDFSNEYWLADPFAINDGKKGMLIFAERYWLSSKKGDIVMIKTEDGKFFSEPKLVLDLDVHLSYPHLVEEKGIVYCIPEMYQSNEIAIFAFNKSTEYFEKVKTLINNFSGVDTTHFFYKKKHWLFSNRQQDGAQSLYIFYSDNLMGPYKSHKLNPVKKSIKSSRGAGTIFTSQGEIFRPSQNLSVTYGGSIIVNKILKLSEDNYLEEECFEINPFEIRNRLPSGIHHISPIGNKTLFDYKFMENIK